MKKVFVLLLVIIVNHTFFLTGGQAFVRESYRGALTFWPDATTTLNLQLGCEGNTPLPFWGPCWDDAAIDAANRWQDPGTQFRFFVQSPSVSATPCNSTDGIHTLAFRPTLCGRGFGGALAVTFFIANPATGAFVDTDTVFDTKRAWTTYSGPLQYSSSGAAVYDFHRVAIHELGHVLGLDHPDDFGQQVVAIMNSRVSGIDTTQEDDMAGIRAVYPASSISTPSGVLENPQPGSAVSGISVISGWVCSASRIDLQVDSSITVQAAYGTPRVDTETVCGDTNNGFSFLLNWSNLTSGTHEVVALADGVEFGRATVTVTKFEVDYLIGASGTYMVPFNNRNVTIEWQEHLQNFVITGVQ